MPMYAYECPDCKAKYEEIFTIDSRPQAIPCKCGKEARKVMMVGGVIGDDMPAWMRHNQTLGCLQCSGDKHKISTRSEYNRYLKSRNIAEISANREI